MKASELKGRAVVTLQEAQKIGTVSTVILDPNSSQVVGLKIGTGLFSGDRYVRVQDIRSVGADAVTVPDQARLREKIEEVAELKGMPELSDVAGTKVISENGTFIGAIDDVIIDMQSYRIEGYELGGSLWEHLTGRQKVFDVPDAGVRFGKGLLVVPDAIVAQLSAQAGAAPADETAAPAAGEATTAPAAIGTADWSTSTTAAGGASSGAAYSEATPSSGDMPAAEPAWARTSEAGNWGSPDTSATVQPSSATSTIYPPAAAEAVAPDETSTTNIYDAYSTGSPATTTADGTATSESTAASSTADQDEQGSTGKGGQSTSGY